MKTLLVLLVCLLSGCSFGMYVDSIQDGSKLTSTYRRDRYSNVQTGMHYADRKDKEALEPTEPAAVSASPKQGWSWLK
jgi:hypothetical protein